MHTLYMNKGSGYPKNHVAVLHFGFALIVQTCKTTHYSHFTIKTKSSITDEFDMPVSSSNLNWTVQLFKKVNTCFWIWMVQLPCTHGFQIMFVL